MHLEKDKQEAGKITLASCLSFFAEVPVFGLCTMYSSDLSVILNEPSDSTVTSTLFVLTMWQVSATTSTMHSEPNISDAAGVDFESLVLMRLRQAEERKRLNEQLAAEDS